MQTWHRNGIVMVAILGFGAARMRFEAGLAQDLRAAGLTAPSIKVGTMDKIGQTSAAVVLGGLRTLVATFYNLRAFGFFEERKWDEVADTYNLTVDLAPKSGYYWDSGFWHSAYNAASYYMNDDTLSPMRRREAWRRSILRGRKFLERGIQNNPDDRNLWATMGNMLTDSNKIDAFGDTKKTFAEAADAYHRASEAPGARAYDRRFEFFALARVIGREKEALALGKELYADKSNRIPTLLTLLFVLEAHENPDLDLMARAVEIFGSPEKAYQELSAHWQRTRDRFPVFGVAETLELLEKKLAIPADKSIFNLPPPPPSGPDEWFRATK